MTENTYLPADTDHELLPVVDEHDNVIGTATRREAHAKGLRHRAVHIVIVRDDGMILLQRRSMAKDLFPGWWDISVGGHVDAGEGYDEAVVRELREELGIAAPARRVAIVEANPVTGWEFQHVYECPHEGPFHPNEAEVTAVRWARLDAVLADEAPFAEEPAARVTPAGIQSIAAWARATGRA